MGPELIRDDTGKKRGRKPTPGGNENTAKLKLGPGKVL